MSKKVEVSLNAKGRRHTKDGAEIPDPTPMAPPLGFTAEKSMFEIVQEMVAREHVRIQGLTEFESPEEADDFDVDDDYDPQSPWEHNFDTVPDLAELQRLRDALDTRIAAYGSGGDDSAAPGAPPSSSPATPAEGGAGGGGGSPAPPGAPAAPKTPGS